MTPSINVLIADDEEMFRDVLAKRLLRNGINSVSTSNGLETIGALESDTPLDVFVCDIVMDGNEDLKLVQKARELRPGLPVILMTGNPTVNTAVASVRLAVIDYLLKPFRAEELIRAVRRAVDQSPAQAIYKSAVTNLRHWARDVDELERLLESNEVRNDEAFYSYMDLTLRNMAGCIADLHSASRNIRTGDQSLDKAPCRYFNCSRYAKLNGVLQDAILTLEATRKSFKSKELHQLRQRLQTVLDDMSPHSMSSIAQSSEPGDG